MWEVAPQCTALYPPSKKVEHSTFATSALATRLVVQIEILVRDTATVVEVVLKGARKKSDRD